MTLLRSIRNPLARTSEGAGRGAAEGETPDQKKARDRAYIVYARYEKYEKVFHKLASLRYRFMARVGREEAKPFEEIHSVVDEMFVASHRLADLWAEPVSHRDRHYQKDLLKEKRRYEATIWSGWHPEGKDEIAKRVEEAVSAMEQTCKRIITKGVSNGRQRANQADIR